MAFVAVFALVAVLLGAGMLAMAVGVIGRGKCLRGSCGGAGAHELSCSDCPNRAMNGSENVTR